MKVYRVADYIDRTNCLEIMYRKFVPLYINSLDGIYESLCNLINENDLEFVFRCFNKNEYNSKIKNRSATVYRSTGNPSYPFPYIVLMWQEALVFTNTTIKKNVIDGETYTKELVEYVVGDFFDEERKIHFDIEEADVLEYSGPEYSLDSSCLKQETSSNEG